jgi:hypothetical protein
MTGKQPIIPKYARKTRVKIKFGQDLIIGIIKKIGLAPPGHIARKPGSLIYLIQIESFNGKPTAGNVVKTLGEEEICLTDKLCDYY